MSMKKRDFSFIIKNCVAEAVDENPRFVLSLDYKVPDRIVAFISPSTSDEINRQLTRNAVLDGVCISGSLSSLVRDACDYFEDERAIDSWVKSLEEAIDELQDFRCQREASLKKLCESCNHPASEHHRPYLGDIDCNRPDCSCSEFAPMVKVLRIPKERRDSTNGVVFAMNRMNRGR